MAQERSEEQKVGEREEEKSNKKRRRKRRYPNGTRSLLCRIEDLGLGLVDRTYTSIESSPSQIPTARISEHNTRVTNGESEDVRYGHIPRLNGKEQLEPCRRYYFCRLEPPSAAVRTVLRPDFHSSPADVSRSHNCECPSD